MKIQENFYPSQNILFWIYKSNDDYYLIDTLSHPILIFLGFYRTIFFKMKARKITKEEAEALKSKKYRNTGRKFIIGSGACLLIGDRIMNYLERTDLNFNPYVVSFICILYFISWVFFLKKHRKKGGLDKLVYRDAVVQISSKGKGIKNWILYNLFNLFSLFTLGFPMSEIKKSLITGSISLNSLLINIFTPIVLFTLLSIFPITPEYSVISIIRSRK